MKSGIKIFTEDGRRIVEGLGYYEPKTVGDLRELVKGSAQRYQDKTAFRFKDKEGRIIGKTYKQFDRDIDCLGTALHHMGIGGARAAIIGENRYEWGVCYLSIVNGMGVAVPLDKHLPANEVENLVHRGQVEVIFYSPGYRQMMENLAAANSRIHSFICMEEDGVPAVPDPKFFTLPRLIRKGEELLQSGDRTFVDAPLDRERMSILLFTSGTTSLSKGVMLSHRNIAANVTAITTIIHVKPDDVHLSLLPLHHTFENTIGLMFMVHCGICIAYSDGIKHLLQNLKEYGVTILVAVPAILEAMYKKMQEGIRKKGKEKLFSRFGYVSNVLRKCGIDLRRKLFRSVFQQLGPKLRLAVSGAAPLDPEVVEGFDRIGLTLLQGYGLTETSPVVAANNDFINVPGTIGYPMAGIQLTIDEPDENGVGEILARGANVMLGYYEAPEATREALEPDGWFRTGDLGTLDERGLLRITGRVKSMIVLTNGKKAFPEEYEVLLNHIPGVKDSFVWGNRAPDGDIQVCAKLVLDRDVLSVGRGGLPPEEELAALFDRSIREINKTIPQYKIIRYFIMTWEELIKTTTLKVRRPVEYESIAVMLEKAGLDMRKASGRFAESLWK